MKCPCERFWSASMKTSCFDFCDRRSRADIKTLYWCMFCGYEEEYEEEPRPRNCPRCGQGMFYSETDEG